MLVFPRFFFLFFLNDTATTEIYTLSLHDALPICTLSRLESPYMLKLMSLFCCSRRTRRWSSSARSRALTSAKSRRNRAIVRSIFLIAGPGACGEWSSRRERLPAIGSTPDSRATPVTMTYRPHSAKSVAQPATFQGLVEIAYTRPEHPAQLE